ncbi:MAG: dihydrolipoamide succinyltransferase [Acidobacteria bacterium]|nr:MAG: dihydrolipoamide succinyltransferase [Acidobacteriota bacterium]
MTVGESRRIDIVVPADEAEGARSVVARWLKRPGESVRLHEPLVEIATDKVTLEVPAPAGGVLCEVLVDEGEEVAPGAILGRIDAAAREPAPPPAPAVAPPTAEGAPRLSPAVRRLVSQHGLDPKAIRGTGRGGRITHRDVLEHLERASAPADEARTPAPAPTGRKRPHSPMRLAIARHMVESVRAAPHVTAVFEADMSAVLAHRKAHVEEFARQGARLTLTAYFVAAAARAVAEVPAVNSTWHDDHLEVFEDVNVGVATALGDEGLVVPVLHRCQQLDLLGIARRLTDLAARARAGRLRPEELQGGTISISNHGTTGSLIATPIIHRPQSALIGVGKLQKRVVVVDTPEGDAIQIRPMVYVTLTIDHRALDGFTANRFLGALVRALEEWR